MSPEGAWEDSGLGSAAMNAVPPAPSRRLAASFFALVALTSGLIVLGALVRAHEAGLACPDWPLCFGELVPRMNLRVAFEWGHRVAAGGISLLFLGAGVALWRRGPRSRGARRLWMVAAALLALQILLGALTVWHLLARWTVTSHLVTGNAFNAILLCLALALREEGRRIPRPPLPSALRLGLGLACALMALQIVLGGLVSSGYAGLACPEWPTCSGGHFAPSLRGSVGLHLAHRWNAVLVVAALAVAAYAAREAARLRPWCRAALLLGLLQMGVGVANVLLGLPVEVTAAHSALAAGLVLCLAAALRELLLAPRAGHAGAGA